MGLRKEIFGHTPEGEEVFMFHLSNSNGVGVKIINYGGIITSINVPDRKGRFADVVLGFNRLEDYFLPHPYIGALIGRYANRIGGARFELDGKVYTLAANNGINHLHGGIKGFDKYVWDHDFPEDDESSSVKLSRLSHHLEEGYPGNLDVTVKYSLNDKNELKIEYIAKTDRLTYVNLSHHGYFNLSGGGDTVLDHELMINSSRFTEVDEGCVPTGKLTGVGGTAMDFRKMKAVGRDISAVEGGYDHNYVLDAADNCADTAAILYEPVSGRTMEVITDQPGIQLYTGNFLDGTLKGKGGVCYNKHSGICLETQHFPDSPNQPHFPATTLLPGERYSQVVIYRFSSR